MNLYSKISAIVFFVLSVSLFGNTLELVKDNTDEILFTCNISTNDFFLMGDLVEVYSEAVEINGKILYRGFIDTLVVIEVTENLIKLEALWNGAEKNLESGYFLAKAERNIKTATPFREFIVETVQKEVEEVEEIVEIEEIEKVEKSSSLYIGIDGGVDYSLGGILSVAMGVSVNFGNNSIGSDIRTTIPDFTNIILALTYTYNFPIHKHFALFAGGGSAMVLEFITDYNLNILNGAGFTIDAGITWVTGINLNISLKASYYGLYFFPDESFRNIMFFGTSIAYNTRRLF